MIPPLEKKLFLGFLVSRCLGFSVSWFLVCLVYLFLGVLVSKILDFLVSKILGFLVSKIQKILQCFNRIFGPYYQMSISCFSIDIHCISNIFKMLLDGSSGCSIPAFSEIIKIVDFQKKNMFKHVLNLPGFVFDSF